MKREALKPIGARRHETLDTGRELAEESNASRPCDLGPLASTRRPLMRHASSFPAPPSSLVSTSTSPSHPVHVPIVPRNSMTSWAVTYRSNI